MDDSNKSIENLRDAELSVNVIESMDQISPSDWNSCVNSGYPFLKHEFFAALEQSGCVVPKTGWLAQHIVIRESIPDGGRILGLSPFFLKSHSWGEFIFDWAWAAGFRQFNYQYYPKLVSQSPFTPITSPKLMTATNTDESKIKNLLVRASKDLANQNNISSVHWLFVDEQDRCTFEQTNGVLRKSTFEFVWENRGYSSMNDFLSQLARKKRKNIRQERKSVSNQGVEIEVIPGEEMNSEHWRVLESCYTATVQKYGSYKYLNYEFFRLVSETIPQNFVFFLARRLGKPVASSICLQGGSHLFGRYWGALENIPRLHFETCYYAAIEYCIDQGLASYNAGVQGNHKLSRGFLPRISNSSHTFRNSQLVEAIQNYIREEAIDVRAYQEDLLKQSPYQNH